MFIFYGKINSVRASGSLLDYKVVDLESGAD